MRIELLTFLLSIKNVLLNVIFYYTLLQQKVIAERYFLLRKYILLLFSPISLAQTRRQPEGGGRAPVHRPAAQLRPGQSPRRSAVLPGQRGSQPGAAGVAHEAVVGALRGPTGLAHGLSRHQRPQTLERLHRALRLLF